MSETKHAIWSPSKAHAWMRCVGMIASEHGLPRTSSKYADDGTASHSLGSMSLIEGRPCSAYIGRRIAVGKKTIEVDADRAERIQKYVDAIQTRIKEYELAGAESVELHVEQAVPIGHITGEKKDGSLYTNAEIVDDNDSAEGTSDAIIIVIWPDGTGLVDCWDLKDGHEPVDAEENEQQQLYTLGAVRKFELVANFTRARMNIFQPKVSDRPSEWEIPIEQLHAFAEKAQQAAVASQIALKFRDNWLGKSTEYLTPGKKQCRWCLRSGNCLGQEKDALRVVTDSMDDFDVLDEVPAKIKAHVEKLKTHPNERLGKLWTMLDQIEDFCKAVYARVDAEWLAGREVPYTKLVDGKKGNRAWTDEVEVEKKLKAMRLKKEEMYNFKLISPADAEKLLKKTPKRWDQIKPLYSQADGKPHVVAATDKRPARQVKPAADDFEVIDAVPVNEECDLV